MFKCFVKKGNENGINPGLNLVDATVDMMVSDKTRNFNLPHVGWNEIEIVKEHKIFLTLKTNVLYFVHFYQ